MSSSDDKNSICSDEEELEIKDKENDDEESEEDTEVENDEEGNNVATHLGSIAHELRRLNKILSKK